MTNIISTNIISPLGFSSLENFNAILEGRSSLMKYNDKWDIKDGFVASLFSDKQRMSIQLEDYSFFESLAISSINDALSRCHKIELDKTILIVSSTKGNISLLNKDTSDCEQIYLGNSAEKIAHHFGILNDPVVVCNACISGVAAEILATRILEYSSSYKYAIIVGADSLCQFFISGFGCFKALSNNNCKPFDKNRDGINLGEAAATIILEKADNDSENGCWHFSSGAIRNDANHISGPSRTGEGSYRALKAVVSDDENSVVSVHGTATIYNDEMESIALERAGLTRNPILALKGYLGHTMGAAGILETIITMMAVDAGILPAVKGLENIGVSGRINISNQKREISCNSFIKLLSGFGGCNGAIKVERDGRKQRRTIVKYHISHRVSVNEEKIIQDGIELDTSDINDTYRSLQCNYPKFYKMDKMNKVVFVASELLLSLDDKKDRQRAVILFNRSSSIVSDVKHVQTMTDFPSPSVFVYTLPNITTGEIAIRNHIHSETSLYILNNKDSQIRNTIIESTLAADNEIEGIITGWVDVPSDNHYIAELMLIDKE